MKDDYLHADKPEPTPAQLAARFKKNDPETGEIDPRINRKGRGLKPRSQKELEDLLDEFFDEEVELSDGDVTIKMERLRALLLKMAQSRHPAAWIHLLDRRFGKVTEHIDLTSKDLPLGEIIIVVHEDQQTDHEQPSSPDRTSAPLQITDSN